MRHIRLTNRSVEAIQPGPNDILIWDDSNRGFYVKLTPKGRRFFYVYYRNASGRQRRQKIGEYGILKSEEARRRAIEILSHVSAGRDPMAERVALRKQMPLSDLWERYRAARSVRWKPKTLAMMDWHWKDAIEQPLGNTPIGMITRSDVAHLQQRLRRTPVKSNRTLALIRAMFSHAQEIGLFSGENPAARTRAYREQSRETYIDGSKLLLIMQAIDDLESSGDILHQCAALYRLLIYTGARLGEIREARWEYLDWDAAALRLPDSKTGKKIVWLNSLAFEQLQALFARRRQDTWIIEGRRLDSPLNNAQKPWRRVRDRAAKSALAAQDALAAKTLSALRIHDLRHSFASFGIASGINIATIGKSLGHSSSKTTERYAHISDNPVKDAVEHIGQHMRAILEQKKADVVG